MILPSIRSLSSPHFRRMDDLSSVMILAIRSVTLGFYLRDLERIECSMAEAMAATLGVGGYRKCVESWQTAAIYWVAVCPPHFRAVCRVCSLVEEAKAKMRVDARVKLLAMALALSPLAPRHQLLWHEPELSPILEAFLGPYPLVLE